MERNEWSGFDGGFALRMFDSERLWRIVHLHYGLCMVQTGGADWRYRGRHFSVGPGTAYMCEPGEVHATSRVYCPGDFTVIFLEPERMNELALELGAPGEVHFPSLGLGQPRVVEAFRRTLGTLGSTGSEALDQEVGSLALCLIETAFARARLEPASEGALAQARRWLEQRLVSDPTTPIRLKGIARELGVSYSGLLHGFEKRYGVPPYRLVSLMRAQHVLTELRRGPHAECETLTAVAMKWGYSDSAHMARVFRKQWGAPPLAIARQLNPKWERAGS
jgi:AraC-like DNA-binding protein